MVTGISKDIEIINENEIEIETGIDKRTDKGKKIRREEIMKNKG